MPSLSTGIQIALQAVLAHSQALEVIDHNVANANTVGYRRQAALLSASAPSQIYGSEHGPGAGMRGTGVTVEAIQRFNLDFFDGRYRGAAAESKNWEMQQSVMVQMEQTLAETSNDGLLPKLDQFWSSWQMVSADPANPSLRMGLIDEAGALSNAFNRRAGALVQMRSDQDQAVSARVAEINALGSQVAQLNGEISRVLSLGEQPNDLLDKRDLLLDRLSEVSGATASVQKNGEAIVSIGGHILVTGHDALQIQAAPDASNANLMSISWKDGQAFKAPSGELKGLLTARDITIPTQQKALDSMALTLKKEVNDLHLTGFGLDGTTGHNFFDSTSTGALNLKVDPLLNSNNLAAASAGAEAANTEIAEKIAALQSKALMGGTETLNQFYNRQVTQVGLDVKQSKQSLSYFGSVTKALSDQRESVVGVSLDEEAANLAKAQKAYQAAARVMTVFDDLLDRIINGMGLAGR